MPRRLVIEFTPELATPLTHLYNSVLASATQGLADWPAEWKIEYGTPISKIPNPQSESDLRVISFTPFFSKVLERFIVEWLFKYIGDKIDLKQFGGLKGNSIAHYLIDLVNFILHSQEDNNPAAVLLSTIDFSKAFNRQNHNILISKLSNMGTPGWLLNIIMGYLSDRKMLVRYKGESS